MRSFLSIMLLVLCLQPSFCQTSPYQVKGSGEIWWYGGGFSGIGISLLLRNNVRPLNSDQIQSLDIESVPAFDRFATRHFSATARKHSNILWLSSPALPILLMADRNIRKDASAIGTIMGEVLFVNTALTLMTKEIVHRPRPFMYNPDVPMSEKLKLDASLYFFSGHTSTLAAFSFATAKVWSDYHPDSRWRPAVWAGAVTLPVAVGYLRMRGGKHFLSDVAVGFVCGAATGWLIPHFHRRR